MRKALTALTVAVVVCFVSPSALTQTSPWQPAPGHITLPLWPGAAPGTPTASGPEINANTPKDPLVAGRPILRLGNVSTPTITLYPPTSGINTGAAVIVFPGGSYHILAIDLEGTEVCDWINSIGVTCVLLRYRVPDSGPYPKSSAALEDAQRALGMVRAHAAEWNIDTHRIGVLGFSAGAHLAAALSTHYDQRLYPAIDAADQQSCRPDFAVVVYPGYLAIAENHFAPNPDIHPTADTPPTFLVQAEDDPVHVENSLVYFQQLKDAGVPVEMHLYTHGGHGYGLRPNGLPVTTWPHEVEKWMTTLHMLNGPTPAPAK
jgi:acetyl esterase/lipase